MKFIKARSMHRIAGLSAALWLTVLGLSGFFLDHQEYRWLWKDALNFTAVNHDVQENAQKRFSMLYQIDPIDPVHHISGGLRGVWFSMDSGATWNHSSMLGDQPIVYSILFDHNETVYLATDNGVFCSADYGKTFAPFALTGQNVKALSFESNESRLLAVIDNSYMVLLDTIHHDSPHTYPLTFPKALISQTFDLNRFVKDLHFARGIATKEVSVLGSDIGGLALVFLGLSGFFYWYLPKRWSAGRKEGIKTSRENRYAITRWLYRLHGPVVGVVAFLPIIYLSITGILIDHSKELSLMLRNIKLSAHYLTPAYRPDGWDWEIRSIVGYPGKPESFSIGSRFGMFTTSDGGKTWTKEEKVGFAWMMRRLGDTVIVGGMGSPSMMKHDDGEWVKLGKKIMMPSDATLTTDGQIVLIGHHTVNAKGKDIVLTPPKPEKISWFELIDTIHSGKLIHPQWKWMNDLFSLLALILVGTGMIRIFRRTFIKTKRKH